MNETAFGDCRVTSAVALDNLTLKFLQNVYNYFTETDEAHVVTSMEVLSKRGQMVTLRIFHLYCDGYDEYEIGMGATESRTPEHEIEEDEVDLN